MKIYLIDRETGKVEKTYTNVINWNETFVEFINGGFIGKIYCNSEIEYFSNENQINVDELNEQLEKEREVLSND